jgi:hypothetical protein
MRELWNCASLYKHWLESCHLISVLWALRHLEDFRRLRNVLGRGGWGDSEKQELDLRRLLKLPPYVHTYTYPAGFELTTHGCRRRRYHYLNHAAMARHFSIIMTKIWIREHTGLLDEFCHLVCEFVSQKKGVELKTNKNWKKIQIIKKFG